MFDIVFPNGNEHEFFGMAQKLGYKGLICVYPSIHAAESIPQYPKNLDVRTAVLAEPKRAFQIKVSGIRTFVHCSDQDRSVLDRGAAHVLYNAEGVQQKDYMHQRGSGLNQVMCALAKKNNIAIGFSFSSILATIGSKRAQLIGRMMQNIMLCRKYQVKTLIGSFATDPWMMRSPHDLQALFAVLGMHPSEAKKSLQGF